MKHTTAWLLLLGTLLIYGCATPSQQTISSAELPVDTPSFLLEPPYDLLPEKQFERDRADAWVVSRINGRPYSTETARPAARRLFAYLNQTYKGGADALITQLGKEPDETHPDALVWKIETPQYTDLFVAWFKEGGFDKIAHRKIPRLATSRKWNE